MPFTAREKKVGLVSAFVGLVLGVVVGVVATKPRIQWNRGVPSKTTYVGYADTNGSGTVNTSDQVPAGSWVKLHVKLDDTIGKDADGQDFALLDPQPRAAFLPNQVFVAKEPATYMELDVWFQTDAQYGGTVPVQVITATQLLKWGPQAHEVKPENRAYFTLIPRTTP